MYFVNNEKKNQDIAWEMKYGKKYSWGLQAVLTFTIPEHNDFWLWGDSLPQCLALLQGGALYQWQQQEYLTDGESSKYFTNWGKDNGS